jgi:hypothetical protein
MPYLDDRSLLKTVGSWNPLVSSYFILTTVFNGPMGWDGDGSPHPDYKESFIYSLRLMKKCNPNF